MTNLKVFISLLVGILVINPLLILPVHANQIIYDLEAPTIVNSGKEFIIVLKVQYDFDVNEDVKVWAAIHDPLTLEKIAFPEEPIQYVNGEGSVEYNLKLKALGKGGFIQLEAYAFHWDHNQSEFIDDIKKFEIEISSGSQDEPLVEITEIQTIAINEAASVGQIIRANISITYDNLIENSQLRAQIIDVNTGEELRYVNSDPLSVKGNYTFRPLLLRTLEPGIWQLRLEIKLCSTGLCTEDTLAKQEFQIPVGVQPDPSVFEFSIEIHPSSQVVNDRDMLEFDVLVHLISGQSKEVSLTLHGLPDHANYSFNPKEGIPDFNSSLIIFIPATLSIGLHKMDILGEGEDFIETTTIEIIIEPDEIVTPPTILNTTSPSEIPENEKTIHNYDSILTWTIILLLIILLILGLYYYRLRTSGRSKITNVGGIKEKDSNMPTKNLT